MVNLSSWTAANFFYEWKSIERCLFLVVLETPYLKRVQIHWTSFKFLVCKMFQQIPGNLAWQYIYHRYDVLNLNHWTLNFLTSVKSKILHEVQRIRLPDMQCLLMARYIQFVDLQSRLTSTLILRPFRFAIFPAIRLSAKKNYITLHFR